MSNSRIFLQALKYTVLTFASIHLLISCSLMLFRDLQEGSLFRVTAMDRLWPVLGDNLTYFIVSQLIWILVLGGYFVYLLNKNRATQPDKKQ